MARTPHISKEPAGTRHYPRDALSKLNAMQRCIAEGRDTFHISEQLSCLTTADKSDFLKERAPLSRG